MNILNTICIRFILDLDTYLTCHKPKKNPPNPISNELVLHIKLYTILLTVQNCVCVTFPCVFDSIVIRYMSKPKCKCVKLIFHLVVVKRYYLTFCNEVNIQNRIELRIFYGYFIIVDFAKRFGLCEPKTSSLFIYQINVGCESEIS